MKTPLLVLFATLFVTSSAMAENPCKDKADAKHEARKALTDCIWNLRSNTTDNCSAKLATFIDTAKSFKACRVEEEKTHSNEPCNDKTEANRAAHNALHMCLERWAEDISVLESDPTDNCASQLAMVAKTEQGLAACRKPPPKIKKPKK
jgi:hypothetical protein